MWNRLEPMKQPLTPARPRGKLTWHTQGSNLLLADETGRIVGRVELLDGAYETTPNYGAYVTQEQAVAVMEVGFGMRA